MKIFDLEDSDYKVSDFDDIEGNLRVESDNVKTRDLWRLYYNNFRDNFYSKKGGFRAFPFHLCAYLYHRDRSKQCGNYNPTKTSYLTINVLADDYLEYWARKVLRLSYDDYMSFI